MHCVVMQLVEHPHSNIFLLKTNLLQLMVDVIKYSPNASVTMFCLAIFIHLIFFLVMYSDSSADSIVRSRATLISGRLLSSADAFTTIDRNCKQVYLQLSNFYSTRCAKNLCSYGISILPDVLKSFLLSIEDFRIHSFLIAMIYTVSSIYDNFAS